MWYFWCSSYQDSWKEMCTYFSLWSLYLIEDMGACSNNSNRCCYSLWQIVPNSLSAAATATLRLSRHPPRCILIDSHENGTYFIRFIRSPLYLVGCMTAVMVGHLVVEEVGGWLGNTGNPQDGAWDHQAGFPSGQKCLFALKLSGFF
jgi:hypothetical protein